MSTAHLPNFEIPEQTPIHDLLEVHPTFSTIRTPFAVALATQLNDIIKAQILEAAIQTQLQNTVEIILPLVAGKKAGYLLRVNLYADQLGNVFVPGGQLVSAVGLGVEPLDALAEAYRAPSIRNERPGGTRDVSSYVWINRDGNKLVMSTIPEPLARDFERTSWTEARRRRALGGTFVTSAPEALRQVKQAEFWAEVERTRLNALNDRQSRQRLRALQSRYRDAQIKFNDAYRSYQLAERAMADHASAIATLASIKAVASLIQAGMSAFNEPHSTAATAKPGLSQEKLEDYSQARGQVIKGVIQASEAEARANGTTLRSLEIEIRAEWNKQGVRRQNIWHNSRRKLAECGPRLGVDVRRRACGV
ncbi:MAG: hypothetical protein DI568_06135, partial [Sphingomonas sp.]